MGRWKTPATDADLAVQPGHNSSVVGYFLTSTGLTLTLWTYTLSFQVHAFFYSPRGLQESYPWSSDRTEPFICLLTFSVVRTCGKEPVSS